ncbi:MAG: fatty acid [Planctomycetota bacterium]|nr:MAG: fatty acid [Planctomycetota bacterium]
MSAVRPPRYAWLLDAFGVAAFAFFIALGIERLAHEFTSTSRTALIILAAGLGYVLADFATGLAHWFCDTFFEEDTPVLGPLLIRSFREHHRDPLSATPRFHHWHHAAEERAIDRNFAVHLPLLDRVFGTLLLPKGDEWPSVYGIAGNPIPENYFVHAAYPFAPKRFERR